MGKRALNNAYYLQGQLFIGADHNLIAHRLEPDD